jgi:hypothetical protein
MGPWRLCGGAVALVERSRLCGGAVALVERSRLCGEALAGAERVAPVWLGAGGPNAVAAPSPASHSRHEDVTDL